MNNNRMSKYEKRENQKKIAQDAKIGSGIFLYQNRLKTDFSLPKPTLKKKTMVLSGEEFEGDSYFMQFVKSGELRLVKIITPENSVISQGENTPEYKANIITATIHTEVRGNAEVVVSLNESVNNITNEGVMNEKKLILDIPDRITAQGKVESVQVNPSFKKLNEQGLDIENGVGKDVLLVESPTSGIEIIN